jgi:sensor domain CHASE-containing protein
VGKPDMSLLQDRLVGVVHALHRDIDAGNAREYQAAVEELSESFLELEESDVPASSVARLRQEQAGVRKGVLRVYHIQREEFLPSAHALIVSFVVMIVPLLMFTKIETEVVTLVTLAFLSFFFLYLFAPAQHHQQAVQGRPEARRRRCQPVPVVRVRRARALGGQ